MCFFHLHIYITKLVFWPIDKYACMVLQNDHSKNTPIGHFKFESIINLAVVNVAYRFIS